MIYSPYTLEDVKKSSDRDLFKVISTFAGGGGSSTGYRLAGGKVLAINEFEPVACQTYRANFPDVHINNKSIRDITGYELLHAVGLKPGELDIFDGSPPCTAFSTAGERDKGWGKERQYTNHSQTVEDLTFEYLRVAREIQAKVLVIENVRGLVIGKSKSYFKAFLKEIRNIGYIPSAKLVNGKYLGCPQARERVIIVCIRKDLYREEFENVTHPKPINHIISIEQAIKGLNNSIEDNTWIRDTAEIYRLWQESRIGDGLDKAALRLKGKGNYFTHIRVHPKEPCPTITCNPQLFHWYEPRLLSIAELTRLGSLPDDYINTGSFSDKWERIGNMVPPFLMANIADNIYKNILSKI